MEPDASPEGFANHANLAKGRGQQDSGPHTGHGSSTRDKSGSKKNRHNERGDVMNFLRPSAQKRKVANMFISQKNQPKKSDSKSDSNLHNIFMSQGEQKNNGGDRKAQDSPKINNNLLGLNSVAQETSKIRSQQLGDDLHQSQMVEAQSDHASMANVENTSVRNHQQQQLSPDDDRDDPNLPLDPVAIIIDVDENNELGDFHQRCRRESHLSQRHRNTAEFHIEEEKKSKRVKSKDNTSSQNVNGGGALIPDNQSSNSQKSRVSSVSKVSRNNLGSRSPKNKKSSHKLLLPINYDMEISEDNNMQNPILSMNRRLNQRADVQENIAALKKEQQMVRFNLFQGAQKNSQNRGSVINNTDLLQLQAINGDEELKTPVGGESGTISQLSIFDNQNNKMAKIFRRYIKQRIDQEYEIYFKSLLKDAKDSYSGGNHDIYSKNSNIRELVGLRVGLEFIKSQQTNLKLEEQNSLIEKRIKANKCYSLAYNLSEKSYFEIIMAFCIIFNTIILSLDRYPIEMEQTFFLEKINIVFTIIFTIEMIIKMFAVGIKSYFKGSMFNVFDCIVVVASIVDMFLSNLVINDDSESSGSAITALRGFRLLRIFKLAKSWKRFEILIETLGRTLADIATFSILLFLLIFTFTLLGLELFAERAKFNLAKDTLDPNGQSPRYNFDTFQNSFTTVFIVLTNDGMSAIFQNFYRAVGPLSAILFFILLGIIGQKILLNLFIAILLENFDEGVLKERMHEYEQQQHEKNREQNSIEEGITVLDRISKMWKFFLSKVEQCFSKQDEADEEEEDECENIATGRNGDSGSGGNEGSGQLRSTSFQQDTEQYRKNIVVHKLQLIGIEKKKIRQRDFKKRQTTMHGLQNFEPKLQGSALGFIHKKNPLRQILFKVVINKYFDYFIIVAIVLSAVQLALDSPMTDPSSILKKTLFWIDVGTTIVFIIEAILKNLAFGFMLNGQWSYMRQPWNVLDFTIIIFSVMSIGPFSDNFKTIKIFRILRSMRLISRNEQLKVAVRALFYAIPNIGNITIIMLLFFLIFGVIAVSYFKGKFYYCMTANADLQSLITSKWDCLNSGGIWRNSFYNFDDAVSALLTLFVAATTAGWSDIMMNCATATDHDMVALPDREASTVWIFFFIFFVIVGAFFFLNLFVGVVISTFHSEHDKIGGNNLLTEKQKEWIDLRLLVLRSEPLRKLKQPLGKFRSLFFRIQSSKLFETFILICILANTIILMLKWYQQPMAMDLTGEILNYFFTVIFTLEAGIKLIAIEPRVYFSDSWNIFDTVIILGSFISIFISANTSLEIKGVITILRSFRILRLVRLIKRGQSLRLIFNTFVITLHSLANIGGLLLLFIFMYSILGMILFGAVKRNGPMNDYINFENFYNSYMTLFIVATGDSWNLIMEAFAIEHSPASQCIENPSYQDIKNHGFGKAIGCGSRSLAYGYFISYMFVVNLIFLKIFIAIILEGYNDTQTQDARLFNMEMSEKFRDAWTEFDPDATTFIKLNDLRDFLFSLGEPLGFGQSYKGRKFLQDQFIASLELPTYQNFTSYQFMDVLDALSFRLMVLDHIQKHNQEEINESIAVQHSKTLPANLKLNKEAEQEIRLELQQEINKLIFQKRSENIMAVKEVSEKEVKRIKNKDQNRDLNGLTSQHHMAAEATVRRMRAFIRHRRRANGISVDTVSDTTSGYSHYTRRQQAGPTSNPHQAGSVNLSSTLSQANEDRNNVNTMGLNPIQENADSDEERESNDGSMQAQRRIRNKPMVTVSAFEANNNQIEEVKEAFTPQNYIGGIGGFCENVTLKINQNVVKNKHSTFVPQTSFLSNMANNSIRGGLSNGGNSQKQQNLNITVGPVDALALTDQDPADVFQHLTQEIKKRQQQSRKHTSSSRSKSRKTINNDQGNSGRDGGLVLNNQSMQPQLQQSGRYLQQQNSRIDNTQAQLTYAAQGSKMRVNHQLSRSPDLIQNSDEDQLQNQTLANNNLLTIGGQDPNLTVDSRRGLLQ